MSTRSVIGIVRSSEVIGEDLVRKSEVIYVHGDGYPEYTLNLLERVYPTLEDAENILALGSLSILGFTLDSPPTREGGGFPYMKSEPLPERFKRAGDPPMYFAPGTRAYVRDLNETWEYNRPRMINVGKKGWVKELWEIEIIRFVYIFDPDIGGWIPYDVKRGAGYPMDPTGGDPVLIG